MIEILLRFGLVVGMVSAVFLTVAYAQRRASPGRPLDLPPGLIVVTGPDCRWCDRLLDALAQRNRLTYYVLDHEQAASRGVRVRSLPTALVVGRDGTVTMRRSGPTALNDVDELIAQIGKTATGGHKLD